MSISEKNSAAPASSSAQEAQDSSTTKVDSVPNANNPTDDLDTKVKDARKNVADLMESLKQTRDDVASAQEKSKHSLDFTSDIDRQWKQFQDAFDAMNRALVQNIGAGLGVEGFAAAQSLNGNTEFEEECAKLTAAEMEGVFENDMSLSGLCRKIRNGDVKKIGIMCGAGISVSAGIPDFRSKGGLYDTLKTKYGMDNPESLFDISYFREQPLPYTERAKEMMPGKFKPTLTHHFLQLLHQKGLIQRIYSQNIDTLEKQCGLPDDIMVYAHGSYADCHCIECGAQVRLPKWRAAIDKVEVPRCDVCNGPDGERCNGLVKPDIVFFG
jgi:hypothetical protein